MILDKKTVCVVIPVYSTNLAASEWASLDQCVAILGDYPLIVVKPRSLDISPLLVRHPALTSANFDDDFFFSVKDYNRMMLSDAFYEHFDAYEFMLIHQLDAFVFTDQLLHWCAQGYDYIGAPWLPPGAIPHGLRESWITIKRDLYRRLNRKGRRGDHTQHPQFTYSAGNGGFSLRRVSAMRNILTKLHHRAEPYRRATISAWPEDLFFSVECNRYRRRLRIPAFRKAASFAWETNLKSAAQLTNGILPFGCHGWNKLHQEEWREIFKRLKYQL